MIRTLRTALIVVSLGLFLSACQSVELPAVPSPGSVEVVPTTTEDATGDATGAPTESAPAATTSVTPTLGVGPASTPVAVPSATPVVPVAMPAESIPEAVTAAQQVLADELEITTEEVTIVSFEWMEWPDSCLGVSQPDEMCAAVITPGYQVMLQADGEDYEYHTNLDGTYWREVKSRF